MNDSITTTYAELQETLEPLLSDIFTELDKKNGREKRREAIDYMNANSGLDFEELYKRLSEQFFRGSYGDVGEVLDTPNPVDQHGNYDIVIGENPNGPGQIELWLLNGLIVSASETAHDEVRDEYVTINDWVINKILNERENWGHNQLGNSEQEIRENLVEIVENPDEIWKDPNQDRWMYTKQMILNGRQLIVVLFVANGEVHSAFVPTHEEYSGGTGYSDEYAKWYIQDQELIKKHENDETDGIVEEVDEGERAVPPGEKPDPTK